MKNYIILLFVFLMLPFIAIAQEDDAKIQKQIYAMSEKMGSNVQYNKIGYEGFEVGSYKDYSIWYNEKTYERGYRTTRANAITSALAACIGIFNQTITTKKSDCKLNFLDLVKNREEKKKKEEVKK